MKGALGIFFFVVLERKTVGIFKAFELRDG